MCYSMFTNDQGGILDDLMITRGDDHLFVVVNAGCKEADFAHLREHLGDSAVEVLGDRALLALQGPAAASVLARHAPDAAGLGFMRSAAMEVAGVACLVSRSGYTGEDGFEISLPGDTAVALARTLLGEPEVEAIGLGARDSLRLEAGLCLYGHDINDTTTPIEAGLTWTVGKRRRETGGFPGSEVILGQINDGVARKRVGIRPEGRILAREGSEITDLDGKVIGAVTSGGFGPSAGGPVAMGYVETGFHKAGTDLALVVRAKSHPARVVKMPFAAHRYAK
jgi:aminomethyltransferase